MPVLGGVSSSGFGGGSVGGAGYAPSSGGGQAGYGGGSYGGSFGSGTHLPGHPYSGESPGGYWGPVGGHGADVGGYPGGGGYGYGGNVGGIGGGGLGGGVAYGGGFGHIPGPPGSVDPYAHGLDHRPFSTRCEDIDSYKQVNILI